MRKMAAQKQTTMKCRTKKAADEDAERAYVHTDSDGYKQGYCSQFNTVWGATIGGKIVMRKAGAAILWHLKNTQYL